MPIARFQMPDGRVGRYEVPEGTTPEQAQGMIADQIKGQPIQESSNPTDKGFIQSRLDYWKDAASKLSDSGTWKQLGHDLTNYPTPDIFKGSIINDPKSTFLERLTDRPLTSGIHVQPPAGENNVQGDKMLNLISSVMPISAVSDIASKAVTGAARTSFAGNLLKNITSSTIGDLGTHTGGDSIIKAASAGMEGGNKAEDFLANMRGNENMDKVVAQAKAGLDNMRRDKSASYRSGLMDISKDKTILDFNPINKTLIDVSSMGTFKGQQIAPSTQNTFKEVTKIINNWEQLPKDQYHTPEGLDALKKSIGDIRDSTDFGTPSRNMVDKVYQSIKDTIVKQAPKYSEVMSDYSNASKQIKEIEKSLSLGDKATADTSLRKLQSIMRNNANTNYGNRVENIKALEDVGAGNISEKLAGQSLNSFAPRGLGKLAATTAGLYGIGTLNPLMAIPMLAQSPRLMGEASYYTGKAAGGVNNTAALINALLAKTGSTPLTSSTGGIQAAGGLFSSQDDQRKREELARLLSQ